MKSAARRTFGVTISFVNAYCSLSPVWGRFSEHRNALVRAPTSLGFCQARNYSHYNGAFQSG